MSRRPPHPISARAVTVAEKSARPSYSSAHRMAQAAPTVMPARLRPRFTSLSVTPATRLYV